MNYRRLTPSMSLLLAFEAAARHESYTRAAEELSLSQSAVSRQVQTLEKQLGVRLFRREGRSVRLTDAGQRYFMALGAALGRIRSATLQVMTQRAGMGVLRLATLPTFGSKWLLPRLYRFYEAHPGMTIHIHSRIGPVDFASGEIDAAIMVGRGDWPGLQAHRLHHEFMVAIAAPPRPAAASRASSASSASSASGPGSFTRPDSTSRPLSPVSRPPAWAASQILLTVASNPQAWAEWFSHYRLDHRQMRVGPSFELTAHLIQAVSAGIGIGLVPRALVEDELARGELACIGQPIASQRSYYLVYPPGNEGLPSLAAFRSWLLQAASQPPPGFHARISAESS